MKILNSIIKPFNLQINRITSLEKEKKLCLERIDSVANFHKRQINKLPIQVNDGVEGIVFSKDRAMQLQALLTSYFYYARNPARLHILYTCSSNEHAVSYEILQKEFSHLPAVFTREKNFAEQVSGMVAAMASDRIFFMTDDAVFLEAFDFRDCLKFNPWEYIFSLRLGGDFTFCYSHNRQQNIPMLTFIAQNKDLRCWNWADMKNSPDWIYPLSVDATIFWRQEIELILQLIHFNSPNSLESSLQRYHDLFVVRKGVCYEKARYVNVPCNIVQNDFANIHTGEFTTDELLLRFLNGERINWSCLNGLDAPHVQKSRFVFLEQNAVR